MLQPCASFKDLGNRTGYNQQHTGIHYAIRNTVVDICQVPQVIPDNPKPQLIRPDHILRFGIGYTDLCTPCQGQNHQDSSDRIDQIPWSPKQGNAIFCATGNTIFRYLKAEETTDQLRLILEMIRIQDVDLAKESMIALIQGGVERLEKDYFTNGNKDV